MTTYITPASSGSSKSLVLYSKRADTACTGVGSANADTIQAVTLGSLHDASTTYQLFTAWTTSNVVGHGVIRLVFSDGTNTAALNVYVTDSLGTGTCFTEIQIFPISSTTVCVMTRSYRDGNVPQSYSYAGSVIITMGGGGAWSGQTTMTIAGFVGTSGTLTNKGFSLIQTSS